MSSTQKACIIPGPGQDLVLQDRPIPTPGPGQVLVKIIATALNPVDNMHRHYPVLIAGYPAVLGCDAAGTVESVGQRVTDLKEGDRVFLQGDCSHDGATFQHYVLSRADLVIKTPSNISDEEASTLPTSIVTAFVLLFNGTEFSPPVSGPTASGVPIVILGGSGSIGRACIQMARIAGFSPIITTASKAHAESLKSIGATHVFERTVSPSTIHDALTGGKPLELAVDTVSSPETQLFAFEALTTQPNPPPQGLQLQLVLPPAEELQAQNKARGETSVKAGIVAGVAALKPELFAPFYKVAGKWVEEGKLIPANVQVVDGGLASVPAALDTLAKGVSGVKLVVNP
ncbi:GroES-like protein [Ceratobasidium sp. AG-I]|nr:GroES-like protein [Ceratobasidium sp. AG-I]